MRIHDLTRGMCLCHCLGAAVTKLGPSPVTTIPLADTRGLLLAERGVAGGGGAGGQVGCPPPLPPCALCPLESQVRVRSRALWEALLVGLWLTVEPLPGAGRSGVSWGAPDIFRVI